MLRNTMLIAVLLGIPVASMATPSAPHADTRATLQAQVRDSEAKIASARARNTTLQAQVSRMEQENAARGKALRERDAEIAVLQQKLQAAVAPASATTARHRP